MIKYKVTLTEEERASLEGIARRGSHKSQKVINALILLNCDRGEFQDRPNRNEDVAAVLKIGMRRIDRVKQRFVEEGLDIALTGRKSTRDYQKKADGEVEAHLLALSCGKPPQGRARWSLRLLADKAVELEYVASISYETVRRILKKTKSNRGEKLAG